MSRLSPTGLKTRGYSPIGHRVFQTPISYHTIVFSDTTHYWKIRLEDGNLNSRGLLSPWYIKRPIRQCRLKDGNMNTEELLSPRIGCRSAST